MRAPLRLALVLAALAALSACNVVMTKTPLFTAADGAGAPPLRPGVWMFFKDADCTLDEAKPFKEWPDCAGAGVVTPGDVLSRNAHDPHGPLEHNPYVIVAGDPLIVQLFVAVDVTASADASGGGGADAQVTTSASASTTVTRDEPYSYAGLRPLRLDAQGRIVAFKVWPVECGPPPPKDANGNEVASATLHPYPGIEMKPGDTDCTTHSQADLRAAARASEADGSPMEGHWVRDGDR